jgi:hypothetical protein
LAVYSDSPMPPTAPLPALPWRCIACAPCAPWSAAAAAVSGVAVTVGAATRRRVGVAACSMMLWRPCGRQHSPRRKRHAAATTRTCCCAARGFPVAEERVVSSCPCAVVGRGRRCAAVVCCRGLCFLAEDAHCCCCTVCELCAVCNAPLLGCLRVCRHVHGRRTCSAANTHARTQGGGSIGQCVKAQHRRTPPQIR